MLKSFQIGLGLWTHILTMKMSRKTKRSNMMSQDLKDMQYCGAMNYKLTDAARASRKMQILRQKLGSVKEYTDEFYKINIRAGHRESDDEKVARYMNGLWYDIQDEMSMMNL
jgi:hypothetical protein